MPPIHVLILRAAGTNCDRETQFAWETAGARVERAHILEAAALARRLRDFHVVTIPGGFSFGDDIAAGRIFAAQIQRHLLDDLRTHVDRGRLILGICNGFQVLVNAGLLPFPEALPDAPRGCTVTANSPPGFQDRWVRLEAGRGPCAFLTPGRRYELPIAHGEGRVAFATPDVLATLTERHQDALRYVPPTEPAANAAIPYNPNGSTADLAGLCDATGRVFGLMPHPERFIVGTQHPAWTSRPPRDDGDGLSVFRAAVDFFRTP